MGEECLYAAGSDVTAATMEGKVEASQKTKCWSPIHTQPEWTSKEPQWHTHIHVYYCTIPMAAHINRWMENNGIILGSEEKGSHDKCRKWMDEKWLFYVI